MIAQLRPMHFGEIIDRAVAIVVRSSAPLLVAFVCYGLPALVGVNALFAFVPGLELHLKTLRFAFIDVSLTPLIVSVFTTLTDAASGRPTQAKASLRLDRFRVSSTLWLSVCNAAITWTTIKILIHRVPGRPVLSMIVEGTLFLAALPFVAFAGFMFKLVLAIVTDERSAVLPSLRTAWRRICTKGRRRVAIGAMLFSLAPTIAALIVSMSVEHALSISTNDHAWRTLVDIGDVAISSIVTAYVIVFNRDLRIRSEGYDLAVYASALAET